MTETRQRLEASHGQLAAHIEQWQRAASELGEAAALWQHRRAEAAERIAAAQAHLAAQEATDARAGERRTGPRRTVSRAARDGIAAAEQAFRLEQAQVAHAGRTLDGLARAGRAAREPSAASSPSPTPPGSTASRAASPPTEAEAAACAGRVRELQQDLPVLEAARAAALARLQELEREANTRAGRIATLKRIQAQVEEGTEIADWLARHSPRGAAAAVADDHRRARVGDRDRVGAARAAARAAAHRSARARAPVRRPAAGQGQPLHAEHRAVRRGRPRRRSGRSGRSSASPTTRRGRWWKSGWPAALRSRACRR